MADVSTSYLRLFLRLLYRSAQADGSTLQATLLAAASARFEATGRGKVLIAASGNGRSHQYALPTDFTATDALDACSLLLDRYDEASAKLGEDATDTEIYDEMLLILVAVTSVTSDFRGIRECQEEAD